MAKKSVFCIATSQAQAENIVDRLKAEGFSNNDISALFPDKDSTRDFAHEKHTKAPEGAVTGAGTGGVLGGVLGWLAGIGALAIPGLGPFIAAGPIAAALSGAAVGATVGGIAGALIGMGMPEYEAKRYEGKVKAGNILISVHAENSEEIDRAKEVFERANAQDISTAGEATPADKDADKGRGPGGPSSTGRREKEYVETTTARTTTTTNVGMSGVSSTKVGAGTGGSPGRCP